MSYKILNQDNRDWKQNRENTTDNWSTEEYSPRYNSSSSWAPSLLWTKDEKMDESVHCGKTWQIKIYMSDLLTLGSLYLMLWSISPIMRVESSKTSIKTFNFYYFLLWKKYSIHRCKSEHLKSFINLCFIKILPLMITIFMKISGSP